MQGQGQGQMWPTNKFTLKADDSKPLAVLLSTGALNPIHQGHVQLLELVASALQDRFQIVGGYLSPSNDLYLRGKFGCAAVKGPFRKESDWMEGEDRLACCDLALHDHPFIDVGRWETAQTKRWPDFPEVCQNLSSFINDPANSQFQGRPVMVLYCCGSDHFQRCGLRHGLGKGIGVCVVSRGQVPKATSTSPGVTEKKFKEEPNNVFHIQEVGDTCDWSSTAVRLALHKGDLEQAKQMLHPKVFEFLSSRC